VATLWLGLSAPALASESGTEPPYPVWWSPVLELDSIEGIDARLARHIWPGDDEGLALMKSEGESIREASAFNCIELERLVAAGFEGIGSNGFGLQLNIQALCRGIEAMRRAQPAERSYLRDFALDEEAIHFLPPMLTDSSSCEFICRHPIAKEGRIPLSQFEPVTRLNIVNDHPLEIWPLDWKTIVTVFGRGDFNRDGLDDMLVLANGGSMSGTWSGAQIYLLSRETPDSVLRVLEAGLDVCANYRCQSDFEDPKFTEAAYRMSQPRSITFSVIGGEVYDVEFRRADEGPPFIVWWWPLMGVENRSKINKLLEWQFWFTEDGTMLEIESAGEMVEVRAKSCRTLKKMLKRGYRLTAGHRSHVSVIADCRVLELLRDAQDAKASHLRDFVLDEAAIELLPQELWAPSADDDLGAFEIADERTLQVRSAEGTRQIRFLAGGDFDGDGLDDVLVMRETLADSPEATVFVLSRDEPDGPLRVVKAEVFRP
jgi:hypothetical protein